MFGLLDPLSLFRICYSHDEIHATSLVHCFLETLLSTDCGRHNIKYMFPDRAVSPRPRPTVHPASASGQCEKLGNTRRQTRRSYRGFRGTTTNKGNAQRSSGRKTRIIKTYGRKKPFLSVFLGTNFLSHKKDTFFHSRRRTFGGLFARGAE